MAAAQEKPTPTVLKKIKVENWSSFLLQKLYHCYTQKKHCDFTLKMVDGDLKVHRIVMNACSNYFLQINLENSHTVTLPPELKKELMEPIVNFIYSGILSFKTNIQKDLVRASKILKIDILTKLIDTDDISDSKAFINKTIPFEDAHMKDRHFLSSSLKESPSTPPLKSALKSTPPSSVIKSTGSSLSTPCTPSTSGVGKMAMKKLPFWKKRSTTPGKAADWSSLSSAPSSFSGSQSGAAARAEEEADVKPSRFELPEDSTSNSSYFYVPNFDNPLSYESESIVKPDERILKRVTESVPESVAERKKMRLTPPPLIKSVVEDEAALLSDEETPASPAPVRTTTPKPILKTDKLDSARKKSVRFSTPAADEGPAHTMPREQSAALATTEEDQGSVHTTDADDTNMITTKIITIKEELEEQSPSLAPPPSLSENGNIHVSLNRPKDLASIDPNHAKIIEEVLLKYPDLVHGNRNFKLKVVNSDNQIINYIMNNKTKCVVPGGGRAAKKRPVVGTAGRVVAGDNGSLVTVPLQISPKGSGDPAALKSDGRSFECKYCGPDLVDPPLATYHAWRVHMTRVHGERFDVRMCEHCGIKLSKRNLYMYHLRRVHNVRSDAMQFPECAFCSYIALSTNLLYKHCKNVHNKHLSRVHGERFDVRMCEHCGIKLSKRNLYMYHLRRVHNVRSDAMQFPECAFCSYIALSTNLLYKHCKNVHNKHLSRVHGERFDVRMCEHCGIKLSKRNLYMYHLRRVHNVRSDAMQFPECAFCSYIALSTNLLYKHCKNVHNKHMSRVHGERFDVRMCEYCGIKLSKRNLYMYHLRRVHNVRSDAMQFPECAFCSYIALSTNLLYKHCKNVHNKMIGHVCPTCNTMFETHDRLADHLSLTDHGNEKSHKCPHCRKSFDRSVNLKAHVRTSHGEKSAKSEEGCSRPGGQEESCLESSLGKASSSVVKKEMVTVKEEQSEGVEAYDGYGGGGGYIEVPVMQSSAYGTLVLPGGVTIIDTNNARMAETSSGEIGMESTLVTSSEAMLEGTAVEPNEAVLGTNECGQTVLILNGTQQYILEQQPDGRLILPDILANNCVISYADDGSSGGGDYEIINVEQAQQEVMMSGQGILVSQGEVQDPGEGGAGPTMYGSHAGESILDSQDPHGGAPTTLVLSGGPYTPSLLGAHAMSSPLIQTVITTAGGHALGSGVIQSINSSGNILHPGSDSLLTSHNESIMTSQSDSTVLPSSGLTESAPPLTEQDSDPLCSEDPANHASGIVYSTDHSNNGMVYSTDHSQAGAVYSADHSQGGTLYSTNHSNNGTVYSNNHSPSVPLSIPSDSQAVRTDTPPTAMELSETGDYQDGYESEGRMVIDTPSDVDGIVESESYEEDSPGRVESEPNNPSQEVAGGVVADASDVQEASHERSESQPSGPELQERLSEGDVSNDSEHISPLSDGKESVHSKAVPSISPLATFGGQVMENSESVVEGATENSDVTESADKAAEIAEQAAETVENIQTFLQAKTTGAAVQAKIQAIEEDWGDTLEDEEEEEEEETQIGPCRGQF